jgi:predicted  nucleic acid-binding Zn-ribbon protein
MSQDDLNDLHHENAHLKTQLKNLQDKIDSMLDKVHNLRANVTSSSGYAKLLEQRRLDPDLLMEALVRIEKHSDESVRLIESIQRCGYDHQQ